ncbi:helix-turn-helix transcriptional regulator [Ruania rhizosphaerae]|uniref:helix-turn-helix transcriptional regulator n=1 Tax=Ruania rhizosphaerae TaxID=1840413 RepID=UPI00135A46A5|nr:WYL domain-containing protein [Ruania rhizosphaerae]
MADVTGRMLALLATLQTGRSFASEELTQRLGVSPRTLRRDVDRLRGYGYPVQTRPGPGGYYRLAPGRSLPPLVLDDDEAVATVIALAALGAAEQSIAGRLDDAATRAYGKIDQFLPARLRPHLISVRSSLETSRHAVPGPAAAHLTTVADAIAGQETITFSYRDARDVPTDRRVEPYRQVHHLLRWYLVAFDLDREDWRTFRLDRVAELRRTGRRYRSRPLPAESALDLLRQGFAAGKEVVTVVVDARAETVADALVHQDAEIESIAENRTRVRLALEHWQWVLLPLAFLGVDFRIEAKADLAHAFRSFGERLVAATDGGGSAHGGG